LDNYGPNYLPACHALWRIESDGIYVKYIIANPNAKYWQKALTLGAHESGLAAP
jgi:hypothetical protein